MNENLLNQCLGSEEKINKSWTENDWEYFQKRFKILSEPKKIFIHKPMKRGPKKPYKFFKKRLNILSEPRYVLVKKDSHNYRFKRNIKLEKDPYKCRCPKKKKCKKIDEAKYKKLSKPRVQISISSVEKCGLCDPIRPVSPNAKKYVATNNILKLSRPKNKKEPPLPKVCSRYYIKRSALKYKANERIKYLATPRPDFIVQPDTSLEFEIPKSNKKINHLKRLKILATPKIAYDGPTKVCVCCDNIKSLKNTSNVDMTEVNRIVNKKVNNRQYYDICVLKKRKLHQNN